MSGIKVGDRVEFLSGSPEMIVVLDESSDGSLFKCVWFNKVTGLFAEEFIPALFLVKLGS